MKTRIGRPKSENPMSERLYIRVTKEEKEERAEALEACEKEEQTDVK